MLEADSGKSGQVCYRKGDHSVNYEQEYERLRRAVAPGENREFTARVAIKLGGMDLRGHVLKIRGKDHVAVKPNDLFYWMFGRRADQREMRDFCLALQAMCWSRYARRGERMYIMPLDEYEAGLQ